MKSTRTISAAEAHLRAELGAIRRVERAIATLADARSQRSVLLRVLAEIQGPAEDTHGNGQALEG